MIERLAARLLLLLALVPVAASQSDDDRVALAHTVARYLELNASEDRTPDEQRDLRNLDQAIGDLLLRLLEAPGEAAAEALIAEVLEEYTPHALPWFEEHVARAAAPMPIEARLESLAAALEIFWTYEGRYVTEAEGLVRLALGDPPLIAAQVLADPWGHAIRYSSDEPNVYELRSAGPDGAFETADDVWTDESGELHGPAPSDAPASVRAAGDGGVAEDDLQRERPLGALPEPAGLWRLDLLGDGAGVTYSAQRIDGLYAGFGDLERGPFDTASVLAEYALQLLATGDVAGAAAWRGWRGEQEFLITYDEERPVEGALTFARFVQGERTLCHALEVDGAQRAFVGERPMRLDGTELQVGEVGPVVVNRAGLVVAYRERRADGYVLHLGHGESVGPVDWVSQPLLFRKDDRETLSYRVWHEGRTTVVVGDWSYACDWARDLVVAPGGDHWAFVEVVGGEPAAFFASVRERESNERRQTGYATSRAFRNGRARLVLDGAPLPEFLDVEEPVFAADQAGGGVAFRAQELDGKWSIVQGFQDDWTQSRPVDAVERPVLDRSGRTVAYAATIDGNPHQVVGDSPLRLMDGVRASVVPADQGTFALLLHGPKGATLYAHDGTESTLVGGPYRDVQVRLLPDSALFYAQVEHPDGGVSVVSSRGTSTPKAQEVEHLTYSEGRLAFVQSRELFVWEPVVFDLEADVWESPQQGEAELVRAVLAADDGRFLFHLRLVGAKGYFTSHFLTFDDQWRRYGPFESNHDAEVRGGVFVSTTEVEDGKYALLLFDADDARATDPLDFVVDVVQSSDGTPVALVQRDERRRVVLPGRESAEYERLEELQLSPVTDRVLFLAGPYGDQRWVVDGVEGPAYPSVSPGLFWNEAGDRLVTVGIREHDTVADERLPNYQLVYTRLDAPGSPILVEGDTASAPLFDEQAGVVRAVVQRGQELVLVELAL